MNKNYNSWLFDWNTSTRTILNCFPQDNITSFIDNYILPASDNNDISLDVGDLRLDLAETEPAWSNQQNTESNLDDIMVENVDWIDNQLMKFVNWRLQSK